MTEQDFITIFYEAQSMGISTVALYLTLVSGYLVATYVSGMNLTSAQWTFVSSLFVVFTAFTVWGVFEFWTASFEAGKAVNDQFLLYRIGMNPSFIAVPMMTLGIIGSLKFAWDIRHTKT